MTPEPAPAGVGGGIVLPTGVGGGIVTPIPAPAGVGGGRVKPLLAGVGGGRYAAVAGVGGGSIAGTVIGAAPTPCKSSVDEYHSSDVYKQCSSCFKTTVMQERLRTAMLPGSRGIPISSTGTASFVPEAGGRAAMDPLAVPGVRTIRLASSLRKSCTWRTTLSGEHDEQDR